MEKTITPGERVVRCLTGQKVDHVPFGVGIGWAPWGETLKRWREETGKPELDPALELGYEVNFVGAPAQLGFCPAFENQVVRDEGDLVVYRDSRGILMRGRKDGGSIPEFLEYPVRSAADWARLKADRLNPDDPARWQGADWPAFCRQVKSLGAAVQVGTFPYGCFGMPRDLLGIEELSVGFYETPELIREMIDHLTTVWLSVYGQVNRQIQIDHIHIWEDMSGRQGSLLSPAMVEEFMMPAYDRIAAFARAQGVRLVSVDTDGDCSELVPLMMKHGINMFFPFEVQAGNDVREYRRQYPELGIVGGLDKRALAVGREEIDREVERARDMVREGRYVPAFDHLIPPDVPWANFKYAAEKIREVCNGG
jgi:hypothetical protein